MSQQSTSCWTRRCNRQYIFLPQFTLVSRCRARDEKFIFSLSQTHSQASSAIAANSVFFTASAAAGPEPRGADDRPNSLEKTGQPRAELFPTEKRLTMNALQVIENIVLRIYGRICEYEPVEVRSDDDSYGKTICSNLTLPSFKM